MPTRMDTSSIRTSLGDLLSRLQRNETSFIIGTAVVIGCMAGAMNILFRSTMEFVHRVLFLGGSDLLRVNESFWNRLLLPLLPMAGALLLIPFLKRYPGEAGGYGFPAFLETVNVRGGYLRARNLFFKIIGPALTIGSGGSAGVEGPVAIIGGTVGSSIGRLLRLSGSRIRLLIAAGSAGAIAATFNAPIAGVMFAAEIVLLGDFGISSFAALVISSGTATVLSRWYYGATPAFAVPQYALVSAYELPLYLLLGLFIGVTAVLYIRVLYRIKDEFGRIGLSPLLKPVLGAFLVGCMGIVLPEVMGNGYDVIERVLHEDIAVWVIGALVLAKIVATAVTLGSGGAGGVFAPALLIGATAGGGFGALVHWLFPTVTASSGAYATVGIGAFLAATTHAPLTGIFLLFEMTGNYRIIVPLMTVSIIGTIVSRRLSRDSIDTLELTRRGIRLHAGKEASVLGKVRVRSVMTPGAVTVRRNASLQDVIETMIKHERFYLPVVDERGVMTGIVSIQDVRPVLLEERITRIVNAGDIATEKVITLNPDDDLNAAMEKFGSKDIEEIPVVSPGEPGRLIGMLKRRDVIAAYNKEVLRKESAGDAASEPM